MTVYRFLIFVAGLLVALSSRAEHDNAWTYQGETGPQHWAELEEGSQCNGEKQSPVNIIRTDTDPDSSRRWPLSLSYKASTLIHSITNNGHSIQYEFDAGDEIEFKNDRYELKQIHFHEPSEHTLNGIRYPIELHLVHFNEELRRFTVLSVLGYEGTPSRGYNVLESYLPLAPGQTKDLGIPYDLNLIFPRTLVPRFHYEGSLTTPPCTENVNWVVFEEPFMLSEEQVELLQSSMPKNNYRGVQPLNKRNVSLVVH